MTYGSAAKALPHRRTPSGAVGTPVASPKPAFMNRPLVIRRGQNHCIGLGPFLQAGADISPQVVSGYTATCLDPGSANMPNKTLARSSAADHGSWQAAQARSSR